MAARSAFPLFLNCANISANNIASPAISEIVYGTMRRSAATMNKARIGHPMLPFQ